MDPSYFPHAGPGVGIWVFASYVGQGLEREEYYVEPGSADQAFNVRRRRSVDNGQTWSPLESMPPIVVTWGSSPVADFFAHDVEHMPVRSSGSIKLIWPRPRGLGRFAVGVIALLLTARKSKRAPTPVPDTGSAHPGCRDISCAEACSDR